MNTKTETNTPCSIDSVCVDLMSDKEEAIGLLEKGELSQEELEAVARTIYMTSMNKLFEIAYIDEDELDNKGCVDPVKYLEDEVITYRLVKKEDYAFARLARGAFNIAADVFLKCHGYEKKNPREADKPSFIWIPNVDVTSEDVRKELFEQCLAEFDRKDEKNWIKSYMVSNLEQVLEYK